MALGFHIPERLRGHRIEPVQDAELDLERFGVDGLDKDADRLTGLQRVVRVGQTREVRRE